MISTRQLKYFEAVARAGSFARAAEHCAVSPPALSMQVSELEATLGVTLIERRHKGLALTEAGQEIAKRAAMILQELRDIADYAARCRAPLSVPLRLGVIPTVAPYMLPGLLLALRTSHPDLTLHIRETQTQRLLAELVAGDLDLLVLALPIEHPDVETRALRADTFLLAAPPGRAFDPKVRVSPDLLRNDRLLLLEEGHCLREQALAVCNLRPAAATTFGASSLATVVRMVASGLGLTLLPEISVAHETARGDVTLVRFADPEPQRILGLAWRKTSPRKSDFEALGHVIDAALAASIGPGLT